MALVSMRQLLDHAAEFSYGLPAFNVNNLEQMRAIMEAADKTDSPVIVQASAGARKYAGALPAPPDPCRHWKSFRISRW
jgi:fructose-bisphosphate aldolase class II